jgi:hypothetical protein
MGVMSDDDKMDALLRQMAAEEYNRPPQIVPREAMWEAVQQGLGTGDSGLGGAGKGGITPIRSRVPRWVYYAVAAVLLLAVGIQVGRRMGPASHEMAQVPTPAAPVRPDSLGATGTDSARGAPRNEIGPERRTDLARTDDGGGKGVPKPKGGPERLDPNAADDAAARAYTVATAHHLTEAEAMLTAFKGDLSQGRMDAEISAWGKDLLSNTRLLLDSPAAKDPVRRKLLQDLELVLVQIVQLSPKSPARDRDLIKGALTDDQVLTRLRTAIPVKGT